MASVAQRWVTARAYLSSEMPQPLGEAQLLSHMASDREVTGCLQEDQSVDEAMARNRGN